MPICHATGCQQPILEGQPTIELSPGTLVRGKKTGGFYHSPTFEAKIIVHYGCVFLYFHPNADAEMYDHFYNAVHEQVRDEELEDIKQQAYREAAEDLRTLCPDCLTNRTDPDKPIEYECTSCGSGAMPICPDCGDTSDLAVELISKRAA